MHNLTGFILKYNYLLSAVILIISVFAFVYLPELRIEEDESMWFGESDPILIAYHNFQEEFASDEIAMISYRIDNSLTPVELRYLKKLTNDLKKLPNVSDVLSLSTVDDIKGSESGLEISPLIKRKHLKDGNHPGLMERISVNHLLRNTLISEDGKILSIILELTWNKSVPSEAGQIALETVKNIKEFLKKESETAGKRFYLGGDLITDAEVAGFIEQDMHRFFPLSLLLAAFVVLIVFKNLLHVFFPVLSVVLALLWTLTLKGIFNSPISPVSTTLFALINVIGIANAIHLISHFNLVYNRVHDRTTALRESLLIAGKACFFTSFTTALGFGSLSISKLPVIRDMGMYAAFGIMSAFIISIILVPAGIILFKPKPRKTSVSGTGRLDKVLRAIALFDIQHPFKIILSGIIITTIMAGGIFLIRTESSMLKYLKEKSTLRRDAEFLDREMSGISSFEVIINGERDIFKEPEVLKKIEELQIISGRHPAVSTSQSLVDYLKLINRALNDDDPASFRTPSTREAVAQSLLLYEMSGGEELNDYVTTDYQKTRVAIRVKQMSQEQRKSLLKVIRSFMDSNFTTVSYEITGFDNLVYLTTNRIVETEIKSISLALGVILMVMCLLFGFKGGIISFFPNLFPIIFLLGFMGYTGFTLNIATSIIASIAIGIVVDDTIHYFTHFRHEMQSAKTRREGLTSAHIKVGSALVYTSASLIMGFGIFLFSETHILINYGLLSGIAVVIALLGDLFLGPALLYKFRVFSPRKGH